MIIVVAEKLLDDRRELGLDSGGVVGTVTEVGQVWCSGSWRWTTLRIMDNG